MEPHQEQPGPYPPSGDDVTSSPPAANSNPPISPAVQPIQQAPPAATLAAADHAEENQPPAGQVIKPNLPVN